MTIVQRRGGKETDAGKVLLPAPATRPKDKQESGLRLRASLYRFALRPRHVRSVKRQSAYLQHSRTRERFMGKGIQETHVIRVGQQADQGRLQAGRWPPPLRHDVVFLSLPDLDGDSYRCLGYRRSSGCKPFVRGRCRLNPISITQPLRLKTLIFDGLFAIRFFRLYSRKPYARLSADADSSVSREKCGKSPACLLIMDEILKTYK